MLTRNVSGVESQTAVAFRLSPNYLFTLYAGTMPGVFSWMV
jgi:hypothetical protein